MKNRHVENSAALELLRPVVSGTIVGAIITFGVLMLCAVLFTMKDFSASVAAPMASMAAGLGALAAGFTAAKSHKRQGLTVGLASGMLLFALILLVSLFASKTGFTAITAIKLAIMALASAIGGILGVNTASKRKMI